MIKNYIDPKKQISIFTACTFRCLLTIIIIVTFISISQAQIWDSVGHIGFTGGATGWTSIAIDGSGIPYVVYADFGNGQKATVMKYDGGSWVTVGSAGFSAGLVEWTSIAIDGSGTPYVVYIDGANSNKATVMKFNGSSWKVVGVAGFSAGKADFTSIAIDGIGVPYVVYTDVANGDKATVMKYNGSSWVTKGSAGFTAGSAEYVAIAIDRSGSPFVAFRDSANSWKATVMKYSGSSWVVVGSAGFSLGNEYYTSLAIDGSGTPYVAYQDYTFSDKNATVMKYNGSSWVTVGSAGFTSGVADWTSIAIDGSGTPYVVYEDYSADDGFKGNATVMKYDGSNWVVAGNAGFSISDAVFTSIAIDRVGTPYVVYMDANDSDKATVMKLEQATTGVQNICHPAAPSLSIYPNSSRGLFIFNLSSSVSEAAKIIITYNTGEKIKEVNSTTNIDVEIQLDAPPGMYFVNAITAQGRQCAKVVVR